MALQGSKAILIVAHRLSTGERRDHLYQLEQGKVAVEGNPDAMLDERPESITKSCSHEKKNN